MREELRNRIIQYNRVVAKNKAIADTVEAAGGIRTTIEQSDKLGFDLECFYVNNILVKSVYVKQDNPTGTEANPIIWNPNTKLIQNAYYIYNGVMKVWMGNAGVTADWDDAGFVLW